MPHDNQPNKDPLTYDGSSVLRNKFGIRDQDRLDLVESQFTDARSDEGIPDGKFDLQHLKDIHKHLFQDVYEWAGEVRQDSLQKGGDTFMAPKDIEMGMADVNLRLQDYSYLQGAPREEFAKQAGVIIGDINNLHPFREGNGRTQLQYLQKLGDNAGFDVAVERINRDDWIEASKDAYNTDYKSMQECILGVTSERSHDHEQDKSQDKGRER